MTDLKLSDIQVSTWNPRKNFNPEELEELQASIEQYGILEPLIVRKVGSKYELVAGERRFRAAQAAGFKTVPVVVRVLTDAEVHEIMLIENLQRSSLEPLEEARSLQAILQCGEYNQSELAARLGKSQSWVANRLRLLDAPDSLKDLLISRKITQKHIVSVLPYAKYPVIDKIVTELSEELEDNPALSVSDLESLVENIITQYSDNPYVFCIDSPNGEYSTITRRWDRSGCDGCKHVVTLKRWGRQLRYCPNVECWKPLVDKCMADYNAQVAADTAALAAAGRVDTTALPYGQYSYMSASDFDITACSSCDNRKMSKSDSLVCLDPKCYSRRKAVGTRAKNKEAKLEKQRVLDAVDSWIASGSDIDTRWLLRCLIFSGNEARVKSALSKYGQLKGTNPYTYMKEVDEFITSLPDNEFVPAIIRLLCIDRLDQYQSVSLEQLERFIPAAVPFYVPAEAPE